MGYLGKVLPISVQFIHSRHCALNQRDLMLDKPPLEDEQIAACIKETYDLSVTAIEFLPIGHDSYAGVYRVQGNGQPYFLKVKADPVTELSIRLPRSLREQGIEQVVAPLPTTTHTLCGKIGNFTLILYPFIEGQSGMSVGLSDSQWIALGALLRKLHSVHLASELVKITPKENFVPHPQWTAALKQLQASIGTRTCTSPAEKELAAFWTSKRQEIGRILDRTEQLGRVLRDRSFESVLCHSDFHTNNVLIDSRGRLFIVDWDQPMLAPKERDLLFVTVGGFVSDERDEALFFEGYGETTIDPWALAYYRYARAVEDMGAFGEQVFLMDVSETTRLDSVKWFKRMFQPGNIVEAARKLDQALPR
jgi:spectinomycin phosphotransferase